MIKEFADRCPRCGYNDFTSKYVRIRNNNGRVNHCNVCGLNLRSAYIDTLYWRWNRTKEEQAAYLIPLVSTDPENLAYCNKELVEIWGGEERLCKFISVESKRKVICLPSYINSDGVLLKGV